MFFQKRSRVIRENPDLYPGMEIEKSLSEIRKAVETLSRKGTARRYPAHIREKITSYILKRRQEGVIWSALQKEIGVCMSTLKHFRDEAQTGAGMGNGMCDEAVRAFKPVRIKPDSGNSRENTLVLVSSTGHRVEGLSVETAAELIRLLG